MKNTILSILAGITTFILLYFVFAFIAFDLWWGAGTTESVKFSRFILALLSVGAVIVCALSGRLKEKL